MQGPRVPSLVGELRSHMPCKWKNEWICFVNCCILKEKKYGWLLPKSTYFSSFKLSLKASPLVSPLETNTTKGVRPGYWCGSDVGQSPGSHLAGEEEQRDPAGGQLWWMNHPENGRQLFLSQTPPDLPPHLESSVLVSRALPLRWSQRGAESPGKSHLSHSC